MIKHGCVNKVDFDSVCGYVLFKLIDNNVDFCCEKQENIMTIYMSTSRIVLIKYGNATDYMVMLNEGDDNTEYIDFLNKLGE